MDSQGVSVVIPCFDGEAYLAAAIDSALGQDYARPLEILVGDDGSRDRSCAIAESYGHRVRVLHHLDGANHGLPSTRNLCLREARHPYVAFLDADDVWLRGHVKRLVQALEENPSLALAVDDGLSMSERGEVWADRTPNTAPGLLRPELVILNQWFAPSGVVARRSVFEEVGCFDEGMLSVEDQDMWLRILECRPGVYVAGNGYQYRIHDGQMTSNPVLWDWAEIALNRARRRYPYPAATIRHRGAVIAYRRSQAAVASGQFLTAAWRFGQAGLLHPIRAFGEAVRWLHRETADAPASERRGQ
jgi:glycosyltransferase involved in cell wall biosynthesis